MRESQGTISPEGAADAQGQALHQALEPRWWKGNLHTHTLWSDGDSFPEMVVAWYKRAGYDFLALSEHDRPPEGICFKPVGTPPRPEDAWQVVDERIIVQYRILFGSEWVEECAALTPEQWRELEDRFSGDWLRAHRESASRWVRIRPLSEFRSLLEEPGRFLLIPSQEIHGVPADASAPFEAPSINAANAVEAIPAGRGSTRLECLSTMLEDIAEHGRATGQRVLASLSHPNYLWACTAEDIAEAEGLRFMEIYTGLSIANSPGDSLRASAERIWDIALTKRLAELDKPVIYGIASDDSHTYVALAGMRDWGRPGKGWIMVQSLSLDPTSLFEAMERGDLYASTGVTLSYLRVSGRGISLAIQAEPGVRYKTQFIGTFRGYDPASEPVTDESGAPLNTTRRYSPEIGRVLTEVPGTQASYRFMGNEIYVRARVISSKPHPEPLIRDQAELARRFGLPAPIGENPDRYTWGEFQMAWSQPAIPR